MRMGGREGFPEMLHGEESGQFPSQAHDDVKGKVWCVKKAKGIRPG